MPTKIGRVRETRAVVFTHTCEECGAVACFGTGVKMKQAFKILTKDTVKKAQEMMGKWYCGKCKGGLAIKIDSLPPNHAPQEKLL